MRTVIMRTPWLLVWLRLALGPALAGLILAGAGRSWLIGLFLLAFLSDVFDGIIARRLGNATAQLRHADSVVDTAFYACVAVAACLHYPQMLRDYWPGLGGIIALELLRYAIELRKYGKIAAYHMWSAKLWGISLFVALVELFWRGEPGSAFKLMLALGIYANSEGLLTSLLLNRWHTDLRSIWHVLPQRQQLNQKQP